jgi:A/G-specific adenine glycosylase
MNQITPSRRTRRDVEYTFVRPLLRWGRANRRSFPWRETDDAFQILVAEVLLQRSRGKTVAKVFAEVVRRWPTAEAMSRARVESIRSLIRPLGLTGRAETLRAMADEIVGRGEVPRTIDDLMELPGVGRYAASATATVAFRKRQPTVDGVTARVYRRFFGSENSSPATSDSDLWELVHEVTPRGAVREWNWAVLDLAASVCLPSRPRCGDCPIFAGCALSSGRLILSEDGARLARS